MTERLTIILLAALFWTTAPCQSPTGNVEEKLSALERAEGIQRVRLLNELSVARRGNATKESLDFAREARELAATLGDGEGEVRGLNNIGVAHYLLAEYDQALAHYTESLELAERIGYREGVANALNNIGIIYYMWGEHDRTLEYYSRAVEIRKELGDREGLAKGYNNLGGVYYTAGRYEEARRYFGESIVIYRDLGRESLVASTLNNIALIDLDLERYKEALEKLEEALRVAERIGDRATIAFSLNNLGMAYDALGRAGESLDAYRRSLAVRRELGDRQGEASCLQNMGRLHLGRGEFDQALGLLEEALAVAGEIQVREIERDTHEALSDAWAAKGDFRRALEEHRLYKQIGDRLRSEETGRKMAELEARFAVEGKDREIEALQLQRRAERLLRNVSLVSAVLLLVLVLLLYNRYRLKDRANREMRRANEAMRVAQIEREKAARAELTHVARVATMGELATTLAHELNQPLTAILSNAQATRRMLAAGRSEPAELDEALGDIVEGSVRAREIIQRLRKLIRRGDVTRESLRLDELLAEVETFARADAQDKGVSLVMELGQGLPEVTGDRVQIQQVLLNLVHNGSEAMAAGGAAGGELLVRCDRGEEGTIRISVRDQGPPVDDEILERMFEPFFTSKGEGLGMGLPICRTIVEAHGGRLWAERNPERGLTLHFALPVSDRRKTS